MASKQNLEYVYNYPAYTLEGILLSTYEYQLVSEDITNQLVRYHNDENYEVAAWFFGG
jgi:hypothetical protein